MKYTMLIPRENYELIEKIEKIENINTSSIKSNRFDGEITFIPLVITASSIVLKQIISLLKVYFNSKKQIKIVHKGTEITCNSIEEFELIMDKIKDKDD